MTATRQQDALLTLFTQNAYARAEASLLQPVDLFLDLSGEDIRRRLYLTHDADGHELCLRPEYTIPVARDYLASSETGAISERAYLGPVFRHRPGESGEFIQAGAESFGRQDREAADAQIFNLAYESALTLGEATPKARIGDVALLTAVLGELGLEAPMHRRLLRLLASGKDHAEALQPAGGASAASGGLAAYTGVMQALKGTDGNEARAFVKDLLSIAGIHSVGGRSAADIAERFLSQSERASGALSTEARSILDRFLALEGDPDAVSADMRALATDAQLNIDALLDRFDARIGFMAAHGIDLMAVSMQTRFVRNLDYYTGFIFEFASANPAKPLIGGGRYDTLLQRLGAPHDIPAVGFSVWLDRFAAGGAS